MESLEFDKLNNENLPQKEIHFTGYNWCGLNTKVQERLANQDPGVNQLDEACKSHDILYEYEKNDKERHDADVALARAIAKFMLDSNNQDQDRSNGALMLLGTLERVDLYPEMDVNVPLEWKQFWDDPDGYMHVRSKIQADAKVRASRVKLLDEVQNVDKPFEQIKLDADVKSDGKSSVNDPPKDEEEEEGVLNKFIDWLPYELHTPEHNFCGPGTKLVQRLKNKDAGINALDEACKAHDLLYVFTKNSSERRTGDYLLVKEAIKVMFDKNASKNARIQAMFNALVLIIKARQPTARDPSKQSTLMSVLLVIPLVSWILDAYKNMFEDAPAELEKLMDEYAASRRNSGKNANFNIAMQMFDVIGTHKENKEKR